MKAIWNNKIIAESRETIRVQGEFYFPPDSINSEYFKASDTTTVCAWKGTASYFDLEVDGKINKDAAWSYPEVFELAKSIEGYVAFWKGVKFVQ